MLIRLGLFGALFFSIFWGIVDTFTEPTADKAAQILSPSVERVETSRGLVDPFLEYASGLNLDAFKQLFAEADADVRAKLEASQLPVADIVASPASAALSTSDAESATPGTSSERATSDAGDAGGDPGIEWYMQRDTPVP